MELFLEYTKHESLIDWKSIFEGLQDYRKKVIEQSIEKREATLCFL